MNSTENCHAAQQDFVSSSVLVSLSEAGGAPDRSEDLLALDEALAALEKIDSRTSRLVELRFVGGLAVNETAAVLGVSERTVHASGIWRVPGCFVN